MHYTNMKAPKSGDRESLCFIMKNNTVTLAKCLSHNVISARKFIDMLDKPKVMHIDFMGE